MASVSCTCGGWVGLPGDAGLGMVLSGRPTNHPLSAVPSCQPTPVSVRLKGH